MDVNLTIALCCAAVSAAVLSYMFVKGMLGAADDVRKSGTSIRAILAPVAILI